MIGQNTVSSSDPTAVPASNPMAVLDEDHDYLKLQT